jgi:hypothetical protein
MKACLTALGCLFGVLLLMIPIANASECPQCDVHRNWLDKNAGACGYHGARLPSICAADPECVQWNVECERAIKRRDECLAQCRLPPPEPEAKVPVLEEFERDVAEMQRGGYRPQGDQQSADWCKRRRQSLANRDFVRFVGGQIGTIVGTVGIARIDLCTGDEKAAARGMPLRLGDCIETGARGRVRIAFNDAVPSRDQGPTHINLGPNSRQCLDDFDADFASQLPERRILIRLIKGALRAVSRIWGRGSAMRVKVSGVVCAITGSDAIVDYDPGADLLQVHVIEGQVDVKHQQTRVARRVVRGQSISFESGKPSPISGLSRAQWDDLIGREGLDPNSASEESSSAAAKLKTCVRMQGRWRWHNGAVVEYMQNNTWRTTDGVWTGKWQCKADGSVVISHDKGPWKDTVTMNDDGKSLSGRNQEGARVSAIRVAQ